MLQARQLNLSPTQLEHTQDVTANFFSFRQDRRHRHHHHHRAYQYIGAQLNVAQHTREKVTASVRPITPSEHDKISMAARKTPARLCYTVII